MSNQGPRLLRTKDGYAYAKLNGRKTNFGRYDGPDARPHFDAFKAQWLLNGRELTDEILSARAARPGAITVDQLAEWCDLQRLSVNELVEFMEVLGLPRLYEG